MLQIDGRWLVAPDLKYRSARNRQGLVHAAPELVTMGSWNLKHLSFVKPCAAKDGRGWSSRHMVTIVPKDRDNIFFRQWAIKL